MELLSAVLLVIWLVGIIGAAASVGAFIKRGEGELHDQFSLALEARPAFVTGLLTVLIVVWPATLLFSIATKRK